MIGELKRSGIGEPLQLDNVKSMAALKETCLVSNTSLLKQVKDQEHSHELLASARRDAELGRMTFPTKVQECDLRKVLLRPRFGVPQQKPDGSVKVRAVDHFSWAATRGGKADSVNGCTGVSEKLRHDTLDTLAQAMTRFVEFVGSIPGLLKADIDAAYRRVPVKPDHRWACGVAFSVEGQVQRRVVHHLRLCLCVRRYIARGMLPHRSAPLHQCTGGRELAPRFVSLHALC